jgi:hypothetical protein
MTMTQAMNGDVLMESVMMMTLVEVLLVEAVDWVMMVMTMD